jgi:AcrR family transcriptional regulator
MEKDHILKDCTHLFARCGVHSITMDDVARHLGISKKTLYKIFTNKDEIVIDFVKRLVEESRLELRDQMVPGLPVTIRLSTFNRFIVNQALAFGTVLFYDIRKYHPSAYELIKQYKREMILFLNDLLVEGQRSGIFRSKINPMLSAELRINVLECDIMGANHNMESIKFKQSQFFDLILNGLQTTPDSKSS